MKSSIEQLAHFVCANCNKWWTIGDAVKNKQAWFCPWCGKVNEEKKEKHPKLSKAAQQLKLGTYEHYKGNRYEVLGVAFHSETLEELVVYRAEYGDRRLWIRPLAMFVEKVEMSGKRVPRFAKY
jgi:hypothetical protein